MKHTHNNKTEIAVLIICIIALIVLGTTVLAHNDELIDSVYHAEIERLPVEMDTTEDYPETTQNAVESVISSETSIAETTALVTEEATSAETTVVETEVVTEAPKPVETEAVTETPETESSRYLGTFIITGYYAAEGKSGQRSATGMPLVPYGTCAMNRYQIKELGLHYGDYITVEESEH